MKVVRSYPSEYRETDEVAPHPLANELTDDPAVKADGNGSPRQQPLGASGRRIEAHSQPQPPNRALTKAQKDIGRQMALLICGLAVIAAMISAALFHKWTLLGLGVLLIVPFMLLLMTPVWLATSTKAAQDDSVKQQRGEEEPPEET